MTGYEDTSDAAYGTPGLVGLDVATRTRFEEAITLVGVPPSLRPRARINLLAKYLQDGSDAVQEMIDRAKAKRQRAVDCLASKHSRIRTQRTMAAGPLPLCGEDEVVSEPAAALEEPAHRNSQVWHRFNLPVDWKTVPDGGSRVKPHGTATPWH